MFPRLLSKPRWVLFSFQMWVERLWSSEPEPTVVKQQQLAANLAQTKHLSELLPLMVVYLPASRLRALILHSLLAASHCGSHGDSGPLFFSYLWLRIWAGHCGPFSVAPPKIISHSFIVLSWYSHSWFDLYKKNKNSTVRFREFLGMPCLNLNLNCLRK